MEPYQPCLVLHEPDEPFAVPGKLPGPDLICDHPIVPEPPDGVQEPRYGQIAAAEKKVALVVAVVT